MIRCGIYEILFRLIPSDSWRAFLIEKHFEKCPRCGIKLASRDEALVFLVQEDEAEGSYPFEGPYEADSGLVREGRKKPSVSKRRFGWAAAGFAFLLLAAFLILNRPFGFWKRETKEESGRFLLRYVKVGDKPAQAYLYRPQGTDLVIIWVEKNDGEVQNDES